MYNDVNINLEGIDTEMTDALLANVKTTQVTEDTHVIITAVTPEVQQQSSSISSGFISKMLYPNPDTSIDSILNPNIESTSLVDVPVTNDEIPPSFVTTLPPPPIPLIEPLQQTPVSTPTIVLSTSLQNLPNFGSLFKFEDRVKSLEDDFSEFKQTNLFAEAVSSIPGIVDKYLANKMNEAVKAVVQLHSDRLRKEAHAENEDFINKIDENIKKIIKEQVKVQVKEQVSKILPRIKKSVNEQLEAEVLIRSSNEAKTSHAKTLYKALVDAYETDKDILATYGDTITFKRRRDDEDEDDEPSAGSNRGSKRRKVGKELESTRAPKDKTYKSADSSKEGSKSKTSTLSWNEDPHESFNELDTPLDFLKSTKQLLINYTGTTLTGTNPDGQTISTLICAKALTIDTNLRGTRAVRTYDICDEAKASGLWNDHHGLRQDKKNRLMRIDELHKFSDGTLNDVRSALDDILKRIRMEYLPQTV
ncbi:hypothetical protein Tco_0071106 [Tanacetum coccineum]